MALRHYSGLRSSHTVVVKSSIYTALFRPCIKLTDSATHCVLTLSTVGYVLKPIKRLSRTQHFPARLIPGPPLYTSFYSPIGEYTATTLSVLPLRHLPGAPAA